MKSVVSRLILLVSMFMVYSCSQHRGERDREGPKSYRHQFKALSDQGRAFYVRGEADSLLSISRQMLSVAQRAHNDSLLAEAYINMGNGFNVKTDFENSLVFFLKGLHLAEEHQLVDPALRALTNLGSLYEDMENYDEASRYVQKALMLLPKSSIQAKAETYLQGSMSFLTSVKGEGKRSREYLRLAMNAYYRQPPQEQDPFTMAYLKWLASLAAALVDPYPVADSVFRDAVAFSENNQVILTASHIRNSYAQFLNRHGLIKEAGASARYAVDLALKAGFAPQAIKASGLLSNIYVHQSRSDSALYYYALKDSLQAQVFDKARLSKLQDIFLTEQIRAQEEALKAEELAHTRRNNIQYAGITVVLISLLVLFLLSSRKLAKRRRLVEFLGVIALLVFFEFINLLLHPLLGRLTHESPVLMLLLLVLLAALLVPLHHKMESLVKQKAGRIKANDHERSANV